MTIRDIRCLISPKLDNRISKLEYYTSLSQLEQSSVNQFVPDANGLDRFKSGIFVDNFSSSIPQADDLGVRNSVDRKRSTCRPSHYTTAFNVELGNTTIAGIGTTTALNQDKKYLLISSEPMLSEMNQH